MPGSPGGTLHSSALAPRVEAGRRSAGRSGRPASSVHSHSAYDAKPSLSQISLHSLTETLSPYHWWASSCTITQMPSRPAVEEGPAVDRPGLVLQREPDPLVVDDDAAEGVERVRPECASRKSTTCRRARQQRVDLGRQRRVDGDHHRLAVVGALLHPVVADHHGGQVGRHRLGLRPRQVVKPSAVVLLLAARRWRARESPSGAAIADRVGRLVPRVVVDREPGGRDVGSPMATAPSSVCRNPVSPRPASLCLGHAGVPHLHDELGAGRRSVRRRDDQLAAVAGRGRRGAVDGDLLDVRPVKSRLNWDRSGGRGRGDGGRALSVSVAGSYRSSRS